MKRTVSTLAIGLLVATTYAGGPARSETIGFAEAIKILADSCGKDIEKYCKDVNLGNNQIQACLQKNEAKVSAGCKADFARVAVLLQARFAAQAAVGEICNRDAQALCQKTKPGSGHILKCLNIAQRSLSPACDQAIIDAGYR